MLTFRGLLFQILWIFQETEHLDRVCEQTAEACLMVAWTGCVPENGAVGMALRGVSSSTMLTWEGKWNVPYIP